MHRDPEEQAINSAREVCDPLRQRRQLLNCSITFQTCLGAAIA